MNSTKLLPNSETSSPLSGRGSAVLRALQQAHPRRRHANHSLRELAHPNGATRKAMAAAVLALREVRNLPSRPTQSAGS